MKKFLNINKLNDDLKTHGAWVEGILVSTKDGDAILPLDPNKHSLMFLYNSEIENYMCDKDEEYGAP